MEHAESRPRVVDMGQIEEPGNHGDVLLKRDVPANRELGPLVQKGKEQDQRPGYKPVHQSALGRETPEVSTASAHRPQRVGCSAWAPTSSR